jgi:hypothetical protein
LAARTKVVLFIRRTVRLAAALLDGLFEHPARAVFFQPDSYSSKPAQNATASSRGLRFISDEEGLGESLWS